MAYKIWLKEPNYIFSDFYEALDAAQRLMNDGASGFIITEDVEAEWHDERKVIHTWDERSDN